MHQMGLTFLITSIIMLVISHLENKGKDDEKGIELTKSLFQTSPTFNVISFAVILMLVAIYAVFW